MSNKRRRQRKLNPDPRKRSCQLTTGEGAKPYDEATVAHLNFLVPGVTFIVPNEGEREDTDEDRLSRARGMANGLRKPFAAVVRNDALGTRYFREIALGSAHELHFMYHKVRHQDAVQDCPFPTVIVVFRPGHRDRIENGLCPIYFEVAPPKEKRA